MLLTLFAVLQHDKQTNEYLPLRHDGLYQSYFPNGISKENVETLKIFSVQGLLHVMCIYFLSLCQHERVVVENEIM